MSQTSTLDKFKAEMNDLLWVTMNLEDGSRIVYAGNQRRALQVAGMLVGNNAFTLNAFELGTRDALDEGLLHVYLVEGLLPAGWTELQPRSDETYAAPPRYTSVDDHFRNFFDAMRTRRPVVEDAVFGLRAAGPALLTNSAYFDKRICLWDPQTMTAS